MMFRRIIGVGLALALTLGAAGCSSLDVFGWFKNSGEPLSGEAFDTPAQVLANEAEAYYRDGDYDEAADLFQQLKDRFPYSRFALLADLRVGDAYAKAKRYDEAVLAYEDFVQLHPKNEAVPYALYQIGMTYHEQMLTPDRDPTFSQKAVESFKRLLSAYPGNEWALKARPRLAEAQRRMAGHDMAVGHFYYNSKRYRAAIGRFQRVLTQYPDVGMYQEAIDFIERSRLALAEAKGEEGSSDFGDRRDLRSPPGVETPSVVLPGEDL